MSISFWSLAMKSFSVSNAATLLKNPQNWIYAIFAGVLLAMASGAFAQSANVYSERGSQRASAVTRAVVLQSRAVHVEPQNTTRYAGSAAGAAIGGGLGAYLGRKSNGTAAALGLVGAAIGGLAGNQAADRFGGTLAVEYIVEVEGDQRRPAQRMAITQPEPGPALAAGDLVYLIETAGTWRVVKAHSVHVAPAELLAPPAMSDWARETAPRSSHIREVRFQGNDHL